MWFKTARELVWLTQLGFSIVYPLLLCVLGAVWLRSHFSLGGWVVVIGLLLGLGGAFSAGLAFFRHTRQIEQEDNRKKGPPPLSFNEHD